MKKSVVFRGASRFVLGLTIASAWVAGLRAAPNDALEQFKSVCNSDLAYGGCGGLFLLGQGQLSLTRPIVSSLPTPPVKEAYLYWHGSIRDAAEPFEITSATLNGVAVAGTHLAFSGPNGWDQEPISRRYSQSCRADVTAIVQAAVNLGDGNGPYELSFPVHDVAGASLVVFYDDGDAGNNRDFVLFDGNDSNSPEFGQAGWDVTLGGISFTPGETVNLQLHVSDGQSYPDAPLLINGMAVGGGASQYMFQGGVNVTLADNFSSNPEFALLNVTPSDAVLWDIRNFDISSFLTAGPTVAGLSTGSSQDYFSLVLAILDVPAGESDICAGRTFPPNLPPVIQCLTSAQTIEANASGLPPEVSMVFEAQVSDADGARPLVVSWSVDGVLEQVTSYPAEGSAMSKHVSFTRVFPFPRNETHTIKASVRDGLAQDFCTTVITVLEPIPPVVDCGGQISLMADPTGFARMPDLQLLFNSGAEGRITATDNQPASYPLTLAQLPLVGASVEVGVHDATVVVKDAAGNATQCQKRFVVIPYAPPSVDCGAPLSVFASSDGTAAVPNLLDLVSINGGTVRPGVYSATQTPAPGTSLPGGSHAIELVVTAPGGGQARCSKTFIVLDSTPVAVEDAFATLVGISLEIPFADLLANDTDADPGDELKMVSAAGASHGTVSLNLSAGKLIFAPDTGFSGEATFTYTIQDKSGNTASALVRVRVSDGSSAPSARDDVASTLEDSSVLVDVLANDSDPDHDPLAIISVSAPAHGGAVVSAGKILYTPALNYFGSDSFSYTISDGTGGTASATVRVQVSPVNDAPVARDDNASASEHGTTVIPVLANDSDPEGDSLRISAVTSPAHGNVVVVGNQVIYAGEIFFHGLDSFTYTVTDGLGGFSTATVFVTVSSVNDSPVAVADQAAGIAGTSLDVMVLDNDSDPDGDALFVEDVSPAAHGTVSNVGSYVNYFPNDGFQGADSFSYTVADGNGGHATATVRVNILRGNVAPEPANDTVSTQAGVPVTVAVLANDTDADGDPLVVTGVSTPGHGSVVVNANGSITYTPASGFVGADGFNYDVSDGQGGVATASVEVTVAAGCNLYPIALHLDSVSGLGVGDEIANVLQGDASGNFGWLTWTGSPSVPTLVGSLTPPGNSGNYTDPSDASDHTVSVGDWVQGAPGLSNSSQVRSALDVLKGLDITVPLWDRTRGHGDGSDYHIAGFALLRLTDYRLTDRDRLSARFLGMVACDVENQAPTVDAGANQSVTLPGTVTLAGTTSDDGLPNGQVSTHWTKFSGPGTVTFGDEASLGSTAAFGAAGTYILRLTADDGQLTAFDEVTITVRPANRPPVALNDSRSVNEDGVLNVNVIANDSDPDGDNISVTSVTQPAHGVASINGNGTVRYAPAPNFNGDDSFAYTVSDGKGGTATATVSITVVAVNDAPVAGDDSVAAFKNTTLVIQNVLANDTDPDGDPLTVSSFSKTSSKGGAVASGGNGKFIYAPKPNFTGVDTFTYTVSDGKGGTATATVTVTVTAVNTPPTAGADSISTEKNTKVTTANLLSNDSDADGDTITVSAFTAASANGGVVTYLGSGKFTYTPKNNFTGSDSFTYTISDGKGGNATATVTVTVTVPNRPPVAGNNCINTAKNTAVTTDNLLSNDSDPDGDPLTVVSFTAASAKGGTVNYLGAGRFTYTPKRNFTGADSFTYTISDGRGGSATGTVNVTVRQCNDSEYDYDDNRDRYNASCKPRVGATFCGSNVTACSTKDIANVVLCFSDGSRQKFDGLSGGSRTLCGTGANNGKRVVGCWIKSGANYSSDGPGYGEYVPCQ